MGRVCAMAAAGVMIALAGCNSSNPAGSPSPNPNPTAFVIDIQRENGAQSFSPNPADPRDREIVFRNVDTVVHRVRLNNGIVDTGDILPGRSSTPVRMPAAGAHYHCSLHPSMIGEVNGIDGGEALPCQGIYCLQP